MTPLILKRALIGWNQDDFDVVENGVIVGRIFKVPIAPQDRHWMWASGHNGEIRRAAALKPTNPNSCGDLREPEGEGGTIERIGR